MQPIKRGRGRPKGSYSGVPTVGPDGKRIRTYSKWASMLGRCKPNSQHPECYYLRGITVCARWSGPGGWSNFFSDMGEAPPGMTLERRDNDKGYSPDNCYWATWQQQAANRRKTSKLIPDSLRQKALAAGLPYLQVYFRIKRLGWSQDRALSTPIQRRGRPYGWRKVRNSLT